MKKIYLLSLFFLSSLIAGCGSSETPTADTLNGTQLKYLIDQTISGDTDAAAKLVMYEPDRLPLKSSYEHITIDSLKINDTKLYYALVQFADPELNRFAIYDTRARLLLLDKSLNGEIAIKREVIDGEKYIRTTESFISKDALSLKRVSLYRPDSVSSRLAFRSFLSLNTPNVFISQEISKVSKDTIFTLISLPGEMKLNFAPADTFVYKKDSGKYVSSKSTFDSIVKQNVAGFNIAQP